MNKLRVIDLLNKIANYEEVPEKIKVEGYIYEWQDVGRYYLDIAKDITLVQDYLNNASRLNVDVEIIEEDNKIDIQNIQELNLYCPASDRTIAINKLVQAVKQLDKKNWQLNTYYKLNKEIVELKGGINYGRRNRRIRR